VIDLHTHSSFSDGSDSPGELAAAAAAIGISAIALTDHDTTASHDEMALACGRLGIELITGVEVSLKDTEVLRTNSDGEKVPQSVHVLCYFLSTDPKSALQRQLATLRGDRDTRNRALVELLQEMGFSDLTLSYLTSLAGNVDSIGRPHFARAMFELHPEIVGERTDDNWSRLFVEWLGQNGRAYLAKSEMTIQDFVAAGKGEGVVFSIAHPLVNYVAGQSLDEIARVMPSVLASLRDRGIRGAEAYYGSSDAATRALMVKLARDAAMIPTGGSDYHGTYKADVKLGRGRVGDLNVPDEVLVELKNARN
jgi:predicted metal-dependent phosphoesterase TrpH